MNDLTDLIKYKWVALEKVGWDVKSLKEVRTILKKKKGFTIWPMKK